MVQREESFLSLSEIRLASVALHLEMQTWSGRASTQPRVSHHLSNFCTQASEGEPISKISIRVCEIPSHNNQPQAHNSTRKSVIKIQLHRLLPDLSGDRGGAGSELVESGAGLASF
jgi:hypothetical protein